MLIPDEAFLSFTNRAALRGLRATVGASPNVTSCYEVLLNRPQAALRLSWNAENGALTLSITHGPPCGPNSWMVLFECVVGQHSPLLGGEGSTQFEDALEYGFDLMSPQTHGSSPVA